MDTCTSAQARAAWSAARTLAELCALTAEFLQGRLPYFPGWGSSATDTETDALVEPLVAATRRGFLPLASQEGGANRCAFVLGFAAPALARELQRDATTCGLRVWIYARHAPDQESLAVGWEAGAEVLVVGANAFEAELELFAEVSPACAQVLWPLHYVVLADPLRGPSARLWRVLDTPAAQDQLSTP